MRRVIVEYGGSRYERKALLNLAEVLSFTNGRPVVKEGDFYPTRDMEIRYHTSAEYAEFENGDILIAAVIDEPDSPAYVGMFALEKLSDD